MRHVNPAQRPDSGWYPPPKPWERNVLIAAATLIFGSIMLVVFFAIHDRYVFNHLSPPEHLRIAKQNGDIPTIVFQHLEAIPHTAPEYKEVPALLNAAKEVEKEDQLRHQRVEAEKARAKRESGADSPLSSYWPTTVRVDTDMDSFWLNGEERTCVTTPGANGRVANVTCNDSGSHKSHNIPVKFWGGVDRNHASSWRCRREGEEFVCRALD